MKTNDKISRKAADNIRILALSMVKKQIGATRRCYGRADFINVLYSEFCATTVGLCDALPTVSFSTPVICRNALRSASLAGHGRFRVEPIASGQPNTRHPDRLAHAIENTLGPLGQGHAMALGAAIAERFLAARFGEWTAHKTYAYISDGAVEEEISQGVGRVAGHLGLSNFIMFYDSNNIQLSTTVDAVDTEDVAAKYRAWNWNVIEVDGSSAAELRSALLKANAETLRPTIIIGCTIMGCGAVDCNGGCFLNAKFRPRSANLACGSRSAATIKRLGGNPDDPF